jgi:putative phosphoesterase
MRIGVLSDAHGNSFTLDICLQYLKKRVDYLYFLGDCCSYFPDVNGVIELLKENNVKCVLGNHDLMLLGVELIDPKRNVVYKLEEQQQKVTRSNLEFIQTWQESITIEHEGKKVLMVHGSPDAKQHEYVYPDFDLAKWSEIDYDLVLMGHTHRPFIKEIREKCFVNVGSCGLPRDYGDQFSMGIFDLSTNDYRIQKIEIPAEQVLMAYPDVHKAVKSCLKRS